VNRYDIFLLFHILSVVAWVGAGTTLALLWLHPDPALRERIVPLGAWLGPRLFAPAALGALADMVLKPNGSDAPFLVVAGSVLVATAAPVLWRVRSAEAGTTST
jgi:hypothetical protein